jgi:hypothetical protein
VTKYTPKRTERTERAPAVDSPSRLAGSEMESALLAFGLYCLSGRTDAYLPEKPVEPGTPQEGIDPKKIG